MRNDEKRPADSRAADVAASVPAVAAPSVGAGTPDGHRQALEALEFAAGAVLDAIGHEDGLDGRAGEAVLALIDAALIANGRQLLRPQHDDDTEWFVTYLRERLAALAPAAVPPFDEIANNIASDRENYGLDNYAAMIADTLKDVYRLGLASVPAVEREPGCIACGETMIVGYTMEGPGPFCSKCWRTLKARVHAVDDAADNEPVPAVAAPSVGAAPDLSNHHNALACPYCNPNNLTLAEQPPTESVKAIQEHRAGRGTAPAPDVRGAALDAPEQGSK